MNEQLLKKQLFYSRLIALFLAGILCTVIVVSVMVVPKCIATLEKVDETISAIDVDEFNSVAENVSTTIEALDMEQLNEAINNMVKASESLEQVLTPLAGLFGKR